MSESSLKERLGAEPPRSVVVADCVALVDGQVKSKTGLSGMAIKGAYGTIKRIKKGFVSNTVDSLLDDWLDQLQPYYDEWSAGGQGTFSEFLSARSGEVADDLLKVTDARAESSSHTTAKKAYQKMRGSAQRNVSEAVPDLARLLERHLDDRPA